MDADTRKMRGARPYGFTNMKTGTGVDVVANFIVEKGGLAIAAAQ
jgi:urease accessory protein